MLPHTHKNGFMVLGGGNSNTLPAAVKWNHIIDMMAEMSHVLPGNIGPDTDVSV